MPVLTNMCKVLLRWSTQRGLSVIPKSNSQHRLQQNLDVTSFDLKSEEIQQISDLDKNLKFNVPTNVCNPAAAGFLGRLANGSSVWHSLLRVCVNVSYRRNVRATGRTVWPLLYQRPDTTRIFCRSPDTVGSKDSKSHLPASKSCKEYVRTFALTRTLSVHIIACSLINENCKQISKERLSRSACDASKTLAKRFQNASKPLPKCSFV